MKKVFLVFLILFSFSCCSRAAKQKMKVDKKNQINRYDSIYKKSYTLMKNNRIVIGDIYVRFINDSVFSDLIVTNKGDTLYSIRKEIFSNKGGKDLIVEGKNFYGYKFVLFKEDYFVLSYLRNKGANISDDITIEWNYEKNQLEVLKVP